MSATTKTTKTTKTATTTATVPVTATDEGSTVTDRRRVWPAGLASGVAAAAATTITVLIARAGGVGVAVQGEEIPLLGFAQLTLVGALIGIALARVLSRRARRPRSTFVRTTVALTALSVVPDVLVDATTGSKLVLALTHVVAAAIVVPVLAASIDREA